MEANRGVESTKLVDLLPGRDVTSIQNKRTRLKLGRVAASGVGCTPVVANAGEAEVPRETERIVNGDKMTVTMAGLPTQVRDLEDLKRVCGIDDQIWDIPEFRQKAYQGFIKNAQDQIEVAQLFSVTARMVLKRPLMTLRDEILAMVEDAKAHMPPVEPICHEVEFMKGPEQLLVVNPTDLHMGKYAWAKESGANYTVEIAENLLKSAIEDLVRMADPYNIGKIVLVVGSDLLNADNSENTTTAGTTQTTDGRQQRTIRRTWQLMRSVVDRLRMVAPVHIVVVNGNHDRDMSFIVGELLGVCFEGYPDVTLDNNPMRRKYVEYGKCLIGFEHGDETKPARLPGIMAEDVAEAWGRTLWRSFETGHLHDQAEIEYPGCLVCRNPALTAAEDWHSARGFIGKIRTVHAKLWDAEDGNIARFASSPVRPSRATVVDLKAA